MENTNVKVVKTYYEIEDTDATAVEVTINDNNEKVLKKYANFDRNNLKEENLGLWENQTETFILPSLEIAVAMMESCRDYSEI